MYYALIIFVVLSDQITKYWIMNHMELNSSLAMISPIFNLTYVHNYGAAFSILQNQKWFFVMITSIITIALLVVLIWKRHQYNKTLLFSFSLIIGGGIGNLLDRVMRGYVVDFFDFKVWPIFNVADISVVCGTLLLAFYVFMIEPKLVKEKK